MTRFAFSLSEACRLPVLLRATTRVCHSRAAVPCGPLVAPRVGGFRRAPSRYVPIPVNARRMRLEIKERLALAAERMGESGFFRREGNQEARVVVLASGAPAATCADLLDATGLRERVGFWRLGALYPLPERQLLSALRGVERLLVVEELSAYLEDALRVLCSVHGVEVEILGKRTGHLPEEFECEPAALSRALHALLGLSAVEVARPSAPAVPPRPPSLCPGCPHRAAFFAARAAFSDDQLFFNDIGCYTLGYGPPLNAADALLCMGAGFTLAAGVSRSEEHNV